MPTDQDQDTAHMSNDLNRQGYSKPNSELYKRRQAIHEKQQTECLVVKLNQKLLNNIIELHPHGFVLDHYGNNNFLTEDHCIKHTINMVCMTGTKHTPMKYIEFEKGYVIFNDILIASVVDQELRINRPFTSFILKGMQLQMNSDFFGEVCAVIPKTIEPSDFNIEQYLIT